MKNELYHHGILGQRWGVRRYENPDGTLTKAGKKRYAKQNTHIDDDGHLTEEGKQFYSDMGKRKVKTLNNVLVKPLMMPVKGTVSLAKKFFNANVNAVKNVAGSSVKTVEKVKHDGIEGEASMDYIKFKNQNELYHHGIIGQRWGVRRFQNEDGSLTPRGERRLARQEMKIAAREAKSKSASEKYNAKTKYLKAKNEAKAKQMQLKNEERELKAEQKREAGKQKTRRFLIGAAATVGIGALIYKYKKHVADNELEYDLAPGKNKLEELKLKNKHELDMAKLTANNTPTASAAAKATKISKGKKEVAGKLAGYKNYMVGNNNTDYGITKRFKKPEHAEAYNKVYNEAREAGKSQLESFKLADKARKLFHSLNNNCDYLAYRYVLNDELYHYGIKGQKWGVRRFENPDGTLTDAGKARYNTNKEYKKSIDMSDEDLRKSTSRLRAERDYERAQEDSYEKRIPNKARRAAIAGGASAVLTFGAALLAHAVTTKTKDGKKTGSVLGVQGKEAVGRAALLGLLTGVTAAATVANQDIRVAHKPPKKD